MTINTGFVVKIQAGNQPPQWIASDSIQSFRWLGSRAEAAIFGTRGKAVAAMQYFNRVVAGQFHTEIEGG